MDRTAFSTQCETLARLSDASGGGTCGLGRSERRVAAARYVQGLLMPGQRKSVGPMAARLGVAAQDLQQFVSASPWSDQAVWTAVRQQIIPHLEPMAAWGVDETGWLKQGQHSVGVSHQYCGSVGKQANCQVSVEVVVTDGRLAAPIAGRLYLPESWTKDRARCARAGVPEAIAFATKPMIALQLVQEALARRRGPRARAGRRGLRRQCRVSRGSAHVGSGIFPASRRDQAQGLELCGADRTQTGPSASARGCATVTNARGTRRRHSRRPLANRPVGKSQRRAWRDATGLVRGVVAACPAQSRW